MDSACMPENQIPKRNAVRQDIYVNTEFLKKDEKSTIICVEMKDVISRKLSNEKFEEEFKSIPYGPLYPHDIGMMEKNREKNRFRSTFPYNHSRIILETLPGDPDSGYINANYIDSVNKNDFYVASQGPRKNTVVDFWRMIWQVKSGKIVMLTNVIEKGKVKCAKYWPDISSKLEVGYLEIGIASEKENLYFSTKQLRVKHKETGEIRTIQHLHFTAWPDHGIPDPVQLMLFHRKYMEMPSDQPGPPIIHCSAGVGRTGTFIALDALYEYGKTTGEIDVQKYVKTMRQNRMNMIQTAEQYIVLHEALLEDFQYQDTSIPKNVFVDLVNQLCNKISKDHNRIEEEFQSLRTKLPKYDELLYKGAIQESNRSKNRNQNILPVERYRPFLMSHESSQSNYINAVIIPRCSEKVGYLVTQYPLQNTVVDLWCMVYDHDSSIIVTLDDIPNTEKDLRWLPTNDEIKRGNFTICRSSESVIYGETKESQLTLIREGTDEERAITLFEYLSWPYGEMTPSSKKEFLKLLELVENWNSAGQKHPITVICSDGATCCGLFCVVYNLLESLKYDDEIDIYEACRQLQLRRPEFFSSIEQYQFCYNVVQEHLQTSNVYVN